MTFARWEAMLRDVREVPGVRSAALISADDGLVVVEADGADGDASDLAALVAALVGRATRVTATLPAEAPRLLQLSAEAGSLLAVLAEEPLWLVALADPGAEIGRLRIVMGDVAEAIA